MAATFSDDGFDDEIGGRGQNDDVHSIDRVGSDDPLGRRHKSLWYIIIIKTIDNIKIATNGQRSTTCTFFSRNY